MTQPTPAILAAWRNGTPVVLVATTDTPRTSGADRWRFAAMRNSLSGIQLSAPGANNWRAYVGGNPLATFGVDGMTLQQRTTWRVAGVALSILAQPRRWRAVCAAMGVEPTAYRWVVAVQCNVCEDWLTHPVSIGYGAGPKCRGYYAALEAKRQERKALADSFMARAAAALGHAAPVAAAPVVVRCLGTCDLDTDCPDCD